MYISMKNVTLLTENYMHKDFCKMHLICYVFVCFLLFPSQEILDQLESLKLENRHLSEMVMKLKLGLHEVHK